MELNVDLRAITTQTGQGHRDLIKTWAPFMKNMLSGMAKLAKHQPSFFYRGRPEGFTDLRQLYKGGREITWAAFTSCSKRINEAQLFCLPF